MCVVAFLKRLVFRKRFWNSMELILYTEFKVNVISEQGKIQKHILSKWSKTKTRPGIFHKGKMYFGKFSVQAWFVESEFCEYILNQKTWKHRHSLETTDV